MKKYNIEGQIDFFNELYKSLDIEENKFKTEDDNNLCLISNQHLVDKYITMNCGHKFNYLPLFFDIKNHKQKFNNMEGGTSHLTNDEIRCPYCRKKQKGVLPYYEELGLTKINGVNYIDINNNSCKVKNTYHYCDYLTPNSLYDPSGNNPVETHSSNTGNCKFLKCFSIGSKIKYSNNKGLIDYNFGDDKNYCNIHKKPLLQIYKKEKNDKDKEEAKKAKEEAKEAAKKAKEEAKKNEKEKLKQIKKQIQNLKNMSNLIINTKSENKIIGTIDIIENPTNQICSVILKTGPNKGNPCGGKISNDNLCARHYNSINKQNKVNK
jgi:hypothetical protein